MGAWAKLGLTVLMLVDPRGRLGHLLRMGKSARVLVWMLMG